MSWVPPTSRDALGEQVAGLDLGAVLDLDVGPLGDRVEGEVVPLVVFEDELRMQVALVLDDLLPGQAAARIAFDAQRLALDQVLEANLALEFREDRHVVRIPLTQRGARVDVVPVVDVASHRTDGDHVAVELPIALVEDLDLTVAVQGDSRPARRRS